MALKGALDFEYRIEKDGDVISVANTKMKDAEPPPQLNFTLTTVELGEAASAVLVLTDRPAPEARMSVGNKIAFETYKTAAIANGVWEQDAFRGVELEDWRVAFYAKHHGDNQGSKNTAFLRARDGLIKAKRLSVHDDLYLIADPSQVMEIMIHRDKRDRRDKRDKCLRHVPFVLHRRRWH